MRLGIIKNILMTIISIHIMISVEGVRNMKTKLVSSTRGPFEDDLNKELLELKDHEIIDVVWLFTYQNYVKDKLSHFSFNKIWEALKMNRFSEIFFTPRRRVVKFNKALMKCTSLIS